MGIVNDRRQAAQLFDRWGPVVHLRDADTSGVARGLLLRQADRGELLRIAKSAFVQTDDWESASVRDRFREQAIAFGLCTGDDAHLTGPAAALLLGLPLLGDPVGLPVAVRPGDPHIGHDRSPYGRVRHGHLPWSTRQSDQECGRSGPPTARSMSRGTLVRVTAWWLRMPCSIEGRIVLHCSNWSPGCRPTQESRQRHGWRKRRTPDLKARSRH